VPLAQGEMTIPTEVLADFDAGEGSMIVFSMNKTEFEVDGDKATFFVESDLAFGDMPVE
jgi:hypothetical protein